MIRGRNDVIDAVAFYRYIRELNVLISVQPGEVSTARYPNSTRTTASTSSFTPTITATTTRGIGFTHLWMDEIEQANIYRIDTQYDLLYKLIG